MFESAPLNPPDAIFGLSEQFKKDPRPEKINLTVGVYQDESGVTPVMECVRLAEKALLDAGGSKGYLPIDGMRTYDEAVRRLVLGNELAESGDLASETAQTPGGTCSLRIAGELLRRVFDVRAIWMSDPTWANHPKIYGSAGLEIKKYGYLDDQGTGLDFDCLVGSLDQAKPGEAILLHTVCHNPTGVDPSESQWEELGRFIRDRQLYPIFDFAYQGFGKDIESDAFPIRCFARAGGEALVCNSFSKNFGLYAERVGGITAIANDSKVATAMLSQIKLTIRTLYSNPPLHGGAIVDTVLRDPELKSLWVTELKEVRERIVRLRAMFVEAMEARMPGRDFQYINVQRGMFSYSGMSGEAALRLREEYSIYALGSGRINIAGINRGNLERLCDAVAEVMK